MEDVAIHYDGTVRNGNNVIVQYVYGDSHLDQVKQKNTPVCIVLNSRFCSLYDKR